MQRHDFNKKLIIGTAQFGMNYGINNSNGMVEINEIKKILKYAEENNIVFLDTAISYGMSEQKLGKAGCNNHKIISKIPENLFIDRNIDREIFKQVKKKYFPT